MYRPAVNRIPNCFVIGLVMNHVAGELGMDICDVSLKNDGHQGNDIAWLRNWKHKGDSHLETV